MCAQQTLIQLLKDLQEVNQEFTLGTRKKMSHMYLGKVYLTIRLDDNSEFVIRGIVHYNGYALSDNKEFTISKEKVSLYKLRNTWGNIEQMGDVDFHFIVRKSTNIFYELKEIKKNDGVNW